MSDREMTSEDVKFIHSYEAEAQNQISAFLNDFIGALWENLKYKDIELFRHRIEINRALADAINKNIQIVTAEWRCSCDRGYADTVQKDHANHVLSGKLAEEIAKSKKFPIRVFETIVPRERVFQLSAPIIIYKGK